MNRYALTLFYRNLARHKLFAAINIGGLALGIAVFVVLSSYVRFENSYDKWLPGWQDIYQIKATTDGSKSGPLDRRTPIALWPAVKRDLPGTVGTRVLERHANVIKGGIGFTEAFGFVDKDFPKVFVLPVIEGDFANAFSDPSNIVLTENAARRYFGVSDPIGKGIMASVFGKPRTFRVAAIIADRPENSSLNYEMLTRLVIDEDKRSAQYDANHHWIYFYARTYIRLNGERAVNRFAERLKAVIHRHARIETPENPTFDMAIKLERITDIHFDAPGKALTVTMLGIVGQLTLLIAIVNYVNLASARAGLRAREAAMRKIFGADHITLFRHYTVEALIMTAVAAVIGVAVAVAAIPLVNAAADLALSVRYLGEEGVIPPLLFVVLVAGIAAGACPAILLTRLPVAAVLTSARSPGSGQAGARVREALVVAQFTIAIAFVVGMLVLAAQTTYVRNADIGFRQQDLMLVSSLGDPSLDKVKRDAIMRGLSRLPNIVSTTITNTAPGPGFFINRNSINLPGMHGNGPEFNFFQTVPGYFETMGGRLLAGRLFDASRKGDANLNYRFLDHPGPGGPFRSYKIIVNRAALAALHIPTPQAAIGRTFVTANSPDRTIIGVVENMRFDGARYPVQPTAYELVTREPGPPIGILRFIGDATAMYQAVKRVWREQAPEVPLDANTAVQNLDGYYRADDRSARLFTIGAVLAVAIGCVGLWGLASFTTARRVKEIGIRKTLGASTVDIVTLLIVQFLRPVLLANLIAWPLAYFAMRAWLAGFDDRIALSPLYFAGATLLAISIAVLTVLVQSLRAARTAPGSALRQD